MINMDSLELLVWISQIPFCQSLLYGTMVKSFGFLGFKGPLSLISRMDACRLPQMQTPQFRPSSLHTDFCLYINNTQTTTTTTLQFLSICSLVNHLQNPNGIFISLCFFGGCKCCNLIWFN